MIFGAALASRVSIMIVGFSVFSGSLRKGMRVSVPDMEVQLLSFVFIRLFFLFLLTECCGTRRELRV